MPNVDVSLCEQLRCGALLQSSVPLSTLMDCSMAGYVGSRNCSDPVCKPMIPQIVASGSGQGLACKALIPAPPVAVAPPVYIPSAGTPAAALPSANNALPVATTATMPSITNTAQAQAQASGQVPTSTVLNPRALLNPLPQIVPPAPPVTGPQVCDAFTAWVANNPMLAGLVLVGAFMWVIGKKR